MMADFRFHASSRAKPVHYGSHLTEEVRSALIFFRLLIECGQPLNLPSRTLQWSKGHLTVAELFITMYGSSMMNS